ncbi:hypothetical protein VTH06DRAFT_8760 [Thermothelomyces fergusii]
MGDTGRELGRLRDTHARALRFGADREPVCLEQHQSAILIVRETGGNHTLFLVFAALQQSALGCHWRLPFRSR